MRPYFLGRELVIDGLMNLREFKLLSGREEAALRIVFRKRKYELLALGSTVWKCVIIDATDVVLFHDQYDLNDHKFAVSAKEWRREKS